MSLDKKIRAAFKRDKKIREASNWSPELHPNIYELQNFLRKSKYRLIDVSPDKEGKIPEVIIEPITPSYLYPAIIHDLTDNHFYIDVSNHGLLQASDVELVVQGYSNALAVVKHLESLDLTKLEVDEED